MNANKNPYALKARQFIEDIKKDRNNTRKVIIAWTPSHSGVDGNEIADLLAKECVLEDQHEEVIIPRSEWKPIFKAEARNNTHIELLNDAQYKGKIFFEKFHNESIKTPWFHDTNMDRRFITFINRVRSNHYNLNKSLARKNLIELPDCECGATKEDIDHVIFECELKEEKRYEMLIELDKNKAKSLYSMWTWLKELDLKVIRTVFNYLKKYEKII